MRKNLLQCPSFDIYTPELIKSSKKSVSPKALSKVNYEKAKAGYMVNLPLPITLNEKGSMNLSADTSGFSASLLSGTVYRLKINNTYYYSTLLNSCLWVWIDDNKTIYFSVTFKDSSFFTVSSNTTTPLTLTEVYHLWSTDKPNKRSMVAYSNGPKMIKQEIPKEVRGVDVLPLCDGTKCVILSKKGSFVSYDGINWENINFTITSFTDDMVYKGVYIVYDYNGYIYTSKDLLHWNTVTIDDLSKGMTFGGCHIMGDTAIVASGGNNYPALYNNKFYYSTDGINWNKVTLDAPSCEDGYWRAMYYNQGRWFALPSVDSNYKETSNQIAMSTNLTSWSIKTLPTSCVSSELFFMGNRILIDVTNGTASCVSTDNGDNWTAVTLPKANGYITYVKNSGYFILAAGTSLYYSTEGKTWYSAAHSYSGNSRVRSIATNGYTAIITLTETTTYLYSESSGAGSSWKIGNFPTHPRYPITGWTGYGLVIDYNEDSEQWEAYDEGVLFTSTDGKTWATTVFNVWSEGTGFSFRGERISFKLNNGIVIQANEKPGGEINSSATNSCDIWYSMNSGKTSYHLLTLCANDLIDGTSSYDGHVEMYPILLNNRLLIICNSNNSYVRRKYYFNYNEFNPNINYIQGVK